VFFPLLPCTSSWWTSTSRGSGSPEARTCLSSWHGIALAADDLLSKVSNSQTSRQGAWKVARQRTTVVESVFHLADETRRLATNNAASSSVAGPMPPKQRRNCTRSPPVNQCPASSAVPWVALLDHLLDRVAFWGSSGSFAGKRNVRVPLPAPPPVDACTTIAHHTSHILLPELFAIVPRHVNYEVRTASPQLGTE
jgi:hypothetical protein